MLSIVGEIIKMPFAIIRNIKISFSRE